MVHFDPLPTNCLQRKQISFWTFEWPFEYESNTFEFSHSMQCAAKTFLPFGIFVLRGFLQQMYLLFFPLAFWEFENLKQWIEMWTFLKRFSGNFWILDLEKHVYVRTTDSITAIVKPHSREIVWWSSGDHLIEVDC